MSFDMIDGTGLTTAYTSSNYGKHAQLGELRADTSGNVYRFVLVVDADLEDGDLVYPASTDATSVTNDYTGGSGLTVKGCGVAIAAVDISEAPYVWVQVGGVATVRSDGSVAAGEAVIGHTVDGEVDTMADGEEELVVGFALEADSGSPVTCSVKLAGIL
jgi:hypothetical protein